LSSAAGTVLRKEKEKGKRDGFQKAGLDWWGSTKGPTRQKQRRNQKPQIRGLQKKKKNQTKTKTKPNTEIKVLLNY
jgi:hypothetical protein